MKPNLARFIKVANDQTTGKGTTESATLYARENKSLKEGLKTEISFGTGRASAVPWIAFIGFNQTVQFGIYPVYLYYKEFGILILAYGVSETNPPENNWGILDSYDTIKEYFQREFSINLKKYGKSYVYKVYNINSMPSEDNLEQDLNSIIKDYKSQFTKKEKAKKHELNFSISNYQSVLLTHGLIFSESIINRFSTSLLTKPFVILTGLSGSGKTKLAQAFALWICQSNNQFKIVPVGADWTNREPLLGYPNSLESNNYVKPDNGVLDLLLEASQEENKSKPHFLILDEMNLSHVERYFADFLSVMESGDAIKLYSGTSRQSSDGKAIPQEITWPKNLFIIGTVNIDETTYMFSPKVLDRANVIEFRITEDELSDYLDSVGELNLEGLAGKGSGMGSDFVRLALERNYPLDHADKLNEALLEFFKELKKTGAEFGYRTASEIRRFVGIATKMDQDWDLDEIIDAAIMQKLLPKLHGSRSKLVSVLTSLAKLCVEGVVSEEDLKKKLFDAYDKEGFASELKIKYPISLEKICRMHKNVIANGFTSYAEA
jgi:5-methylcytosine-specific restriction protein B